MILYRIVRADPPTLVDFTSGARLGRPLANPTPETLRLHTGLSVFETSDQAVAMARRIRRLGRFVAVLDVPDNTPIQVERSTSRPGHHTLWGQADTILGCVIAVLPIDAR